MLTETWRALAEGGRHEGERTDIRPLQCGVADPLGHDPRLRERGRWRGSNQGNTQSEKSLYRPGSIDVRYLPGNGTLEPRRVLLLLTRRFVFGRSRDLVACFRG
jgi:hypothetical protein